MSSQVKQNPIKKIMSKRGMGQVITVTLGLIVLFIVFHFLSDRFLTPLNISNLLQQIAPILIIGIGQSYVLITGNIDLSIGSVLGMSAMISATLMCNGMNPILVIGITLAASLFTGIANGQLVARFKLPPFIATLGTMTIARGVAQIVNDNRNTDAIGKGIGQAAEQAFRDFFYTGKVLSFKIGAPQEGGGAPTNVFTLYSAVLIAIVLWVVWNFILSKTRSGRHIYAIGSNIEAARLSGVDVTATTTKAYMISAFCSCVAGLITCATTGMGAMDAGNSYELYAVAASVIGGVSTLGGQGILMGTVIGAAIWGVLANGLGMANVKVAWRNIIIGVIVIFSVLLDVIVRSGNKRRKVDITGAKTTLPPKAE